LGIRLKKTKRDSLPKNKSSNALESVEPVVVSIPSFNITDDMKSASYKSLVKIQSLRDTLCYNLGISGKPEENLPQENTYYENRDSGDKVNTRDGFVLDNFVGTYERQLPVKLLKYIYSKGSKANKNASAHKSNRNTVPATLLRHYLVSRKDEVSTTIRLPRTCI